MSIESKIPIADLNIKDLSLEKTEATETSFEFNANEYLSGEIHSNIDTLIGHQLKLKPEDHNKEIPLKLAFDLAIVKPEDFDQMPHNQRIFKAMAQNHWDRKQPTQHTEMDDFTVLGMALTFNYPETVNHAPVLLESEWNDSFRMYAKELQGISSAESNSYVFYMSKLYYLKLLNPEWFANTHFTAGSLDNFLPKMLENLRDENNIPVWTRIEALGQVLAYTKLLDPNFNAEKKDFSTLKELLRDIRVTAGLDSPKSPDRWPAPNPLVEYMDACAALKIISAKNIKFTDKGLKFEKGSKIASADYKTAPMPEVKKF